MNALQRKAKSLGTYYIEGEVIDFGFKGDASIVVEEDPSKEYEGINSVKVCKIWIYLYHCKIFSKSDPRLDGILLKMDNTSSSGSNI